MLSVFLFEHTDDTVAPENLSYGQILTSSRSYAVNSGKVHHSPISAKRLGRQYIGFELDKKYAEISQQKLEQVKPNFKIGESWVSFYLKDIVTIRNNDWKNLETYFDVPNPARTIDFQKIKLKSGIKIPKEIEFVAPNSNEKEKILTN